MPPLQQPVLTVPSWMYDDETPDQPYGSSAIRESHLENALKSEYALNDILPLSIENPDSAGPSLNNFIALAASTEVMEDPEMECPTMRVRNSSMFSEELLQPFTALSTTTEGIGSEARLHLKKAFATEVFLTLLARTKNQHVMPFLCICLGL